MPEIAYTTVGNYLIEKNIVPGRDLKVVTLDRYTPSDLYIFD
jgi:hypothetical protein